MRWNLMFTVVNTGFCGFDIGTHEWVLAVLSAAVAGLGIAVLWLTLRELEREVA